MRPLSLIIHHIIVSTFLFQINSALAASEFTHSKPQKKATDIWERVRSGMKMPMPFSSMQPPTTTAKESPKIEPEIVVNEPEKPAEEPKKSKYLIEPNKVVAPLYNYTELGLKIRFGSTNPPTNKVENNEVAKNEIAKVIEIKPPLLPKIEKLDTKTTIIDERIKKHIDFFRQKPGYLYQVTERARPYLYGIVEELSKKQLPLELALLPIVESAYQPEAQSPKGAAGLWQFMPATGNDYGLKQNEQNDERLDIQASTRAAIHFLTDLKTHYKGDWLLALAAYNCGQGSVDNAISKNLANGLKVDYWSLDLPKETQDYVPRLLALSHIFANPALYGLKFAPIKNEPYFKV